MWWLDKGGSYRANGLFGQGIYINPEENVVIALHSALEAPSTRRVRRLRIAFYRALTNAVQY